MGKLRAARAVKRFLREEDLKVNMKERISKRAKSITAPRPKGL